MKAYLSIIMIAIGWLASQGLKAQVSMKPERCVEIPTENRNTVPLTVSELAKLETQINDAIAAYNATTKWSKIKGKYLTQLQQTTNAQGHREVMVNCLCHSWPGWRQEITHAYDGGSCYFRMKVDLDTGRAYDIMVNGVA